MLISVDVRVVYVLACTSRGVFLVYSNARTVAYTTIDAKVVRLMRSFVLKSLVP